MITHSYQTTQTGLVLFAVLYTDNKEKIFNHATGEFDFLVDSCPLNSDYILPLDEVYCGNGFYFASQECVCDPQYLITDIYEDLVTDPYDPYGTDTFTILDSKRFYYNGTKEVGEEYRQLIYDAIQNANAQIISLLVEIRTLQQNQASQFDINDRLNKIYALVQHIQGMIASSPRK